MAYTLSKLYRDWASLLGLVQYHNATNGSTTTATFGNWSTKEDPPETDAFVEWTLVVDRDAGGSSAAPEGEFGRISGYADGTFVATVDTALTAAIASGDRIGLVKPTITLEQFKSTIGRSIRNLGKIGLASTAVTWVADTYTYNLGSGVRNITRIDVENSDGVRVMLPRAAWEIRPYAAGGTAVLYIHPEFLPSSSDTSRIWYLGEHADVNAFGDELSDTIEPALLAAQVAYDSLDFLPPTSQLVQNKQEKITIQLNAMIQKHGGYPKTPKKYNKTLTLGRNRSDGFGSQWP